MSHDHAHKPGGKLSGVRLYVRPKLYPVATGGVLMHGSHSCRSWCAFLLRRQCPLNGDDFGSVIARYWPAAAELSCTAGFDPLLSPVTVGYRGPHHRSNRIASEYHTDRVATK